jgi:hypothetical protein
MQLELTAQEAQVLRELVEHALGNIKEEAYHTDSQDYKRLVKAREATIVGILKKLQGDIALAS